LKEQPGSFGIENGANTGFDSRPERSMAVINNEQ